MRHRPGLDGEGADVEPSLRARRRPCREVGLCGDVGHLELDVVVQRRDIAAHAGADADPRKQGLLDVEGHPQVGQVEDGHHGIAAAHQFALFGDDGRNLARHGRIDHRVADVGFDLAHGSFGLADTCRSGLLVLLAGSVRRQVVLRLGGQRRGFHRLVVGRRLVQLLLGDYPLVVEVLHAVVGLARQFQPGLRLLPHVQGGFDLLDAGACQGCLVECRGGALHGLGLLEFGLQLGGRERVEQLPLLHAVALTDLHVVDAPRDFRRGFVGRALHRALYQHRGRFPEVPTDQDDRDDDDHSGRDDSDNVASLHRILYFFTFYRTGSAGRRRGGRKPKIRR